jgi:tetratricopeptide (TPR) repeat protein
LVLGEDPGLLDQSSSGTGLVLTLVWFLAAVGWAVWRAWSGEASPLLSAVEGGLLVVVGTVMASALGAASYKHPAWLIVSEWFVFLIVFVLVRQLVRTEGENRRLLAALLASAVSLSAFAIFQRTVEMPDQYKQFDNPQRLVQALAKEGIYVDEKDPMLEHWKKRIQSNAVYATFAHPNSFASYLALLLPAAVGLTLATWRRRTQESGAKIEDQGSKNESSSILDPRSSTRTWLAGACALLIAAALWLTNGRGAILVSVVAVGAVFALNRARSVSDGSRSPVANAPGSDKRRLLAIASAVVVVILLVFFLNRTDALKEEAPETLQKRLDYWSATVKMIRDHPWLGVGPGHFGRFYPRYMKETAFQKIKDPHNFALEIWSTCGIFALLALMVVIAGFFWQTRRAWLGAEASKEKTKDQESARTETSQTFIMGEWWILPAPAQEARWPFYLGGMAGLTLAFVLWTSDLSKENLADQMTYGTFVAGMRSLIWFAAFGLFESIAWTGPGRTRALIAGVIGLLASLLVGAGIGYPSVAQPLWVMAALAVNSLGQLVPIVQPRSWLAAMAPLPVAGVICLGFCIFIYSPVAACMGPLREARSYYGTYAVKLEEGQQNESRTAAQQAMLEAQKTLTHIVSQLRLSAFGSPRHRGQEAVLASPFVELAEWKAEEWKHNYAHGQAQIDVRQTARSAAEHAIRLDPDGLDGYWAKYHVNMIFAKGAKTEVRKFYEDASQAMARLVDLDPTEARFHFELADLKFQLDDQAGWEKESQEALGLDEISTDPTRKLKPSQRLLVLSRQEPGNIGLRFDLAQALYHEGDTERGKKTAEEVQRLDQETNAPARLSEAQRKQIEAWLKSG